MPAIALPARRSWISLIYWVLVTIVFLYDRTYLIVKAGLPSFFLCSVVRIGLLVALAWVNPHFLFNALNNLYALTIRKSDEAPGLVLKLSEMMEYMLYESDGDFVPLEKEINYLRNYLHLEKIRQGNEADIRLTVAGDIDKCAIPYRLGGIIRRRFSGGL